MRLIRTKTAGRHGMIRLADLPDMNLLAVRTLINVPHNAALCGPDKCGSAPIIPGEKRVPA